MQAPAWYVLWNPIPENRGIYWLLRGRHFRFVLFYFILFYFNSFKFSLFNLILFIHHYSLGYAGFICLLLLRFWWGGPAFLTGWRSSHRRLPQTRNRQHGIVILQKTLAFKPFMTGHLIKPSDNCFYSGTGPRRMFYLARILEDGWSPTQGGYSIVAMVLKTREEPIVSSILICWVFPEPLSLSLCPWVSVSESPSLVYYTALGVDPEEQMEYRILLRPSSSYHQYVVFCTSCDNESVLCNCAIMAFTHIVRWKHCATKTLLKAVKAQVFLTTTTETSKRRAPELLPSLHNPTTLISCEVWALSWSSCWRPLPVPSTIQLPLQLHPTAVQARASIRP